MFKPYNDFLHLRNLKEQEDIATCSLQYPPHLVKTFEFYCQRVIYAVMIILLIKICKMFLLKCMNYVSNNLYIICHC